MYDSCAAAVLRDDRGSHGKRPFPFGPKVTHPKHLRGDEERWAGRRAECTGGLMLRARAAALLPRGPGQARPKSLDTCGPGSGSQCFSCLVVRHPGTPRLLLGSYYWSAVLPLGLTGPGGEPNAKRLRCPTRPALRLRLETAAD
jgi:hypothetical protein